MPEPADAPAASSSRTRTADLRAAIADLVAAITPCDELESEQLAAALRWIESEAELFRTTPPDVPPMHLVSYFVPFDARCGSLLLTAHRKSGLDLPPGGHCEPGELPWQTTQRECLEELAVPAVALRQVGPHPLLLTVTQTRTTLPGRHTDVSLWFVLDVDADNPALRPDPREFSSVRWFTLDELFAEPIERFDPHMHRFARKLHRTLTATASVPAPTPARPPVPASAPAPSAHQPCSP
jgi:8-oxo-dGTP pyrophosphatase MutT (NUDIX family)